MNKIFNIILTLLTFIAILSLGTVANAGGVANVSTADEFKEAVDNSASEINVMTNIDLTGKGILDVSETTINLNGNTILAKNFSVVFQGSNFTIKNGNFDSRGGGATSGSYGLFIGDSYTNNVTIENINITGGINIYNSANVVLQNVNINVPENFKPYAYYAIWCESNTHVIVKSGNFTSAGYAVLGMDNNGTSLDIEGGTFTTQGNPLVLQGNYNIPTIKGGTFNVPVSENYCASGYEPVKLGENNYTVCNHANTVTKNVVAPTCTIDGYSGDICCSICNKVMQTGTTISATGHNYSSLNFDKNNHWKECTKCKEIMPDSLEPHKFGSNDKCEICDYENINKTLQDNNTNIKLDFKDNVLEDNTILQVTPIAEGLDYEKIQTVLSNVKKFVVFDINLLRNGVKIQPSGNILVSIPVPEHFNKNKLEVYRMDRENKIKYDIKLTVIDNKDYVQFETNHFSYYVIAEKISSNSGAGVPVSSINQNEANVTEHKLDNEPKAGVFNSSLFAEIIFILSLSGYIICKKKSV